MKLLFATGNENKYELMKRRLEKFKDIEVIMPKHINVNINVIEDGITAEENAIKKASAYYNETKMATIAEDSGLWVEKFSKEEQPGLFVKRVNGRDDLSDEEILNYYIEKIRKIGGQTNARYKTGIVVINEEGEVFSKVIDEELFLLTEKKNDKGYIKGGLLDIISYDSINKKYFNELSKEEKSRRYEKIDEEIRQMIKEILK